MKGISSFRKYSSHPAHEVMLTLYLLASWALPVSERAQWVFTVSLHSSPQVAYSCHKQFINDYLKDDKAEVSDGYESCTTILKAFYTPLEPSEDFGAARRLVLVDTPGFNSTCGHDFRLLQRIALCLTSS